MDSKNSLKRVAVVGATGLVGRTILKILEERNFPISELIPIASEKSAGSEIEFNNKKYKVTTLEKGLTLSPQIALFSAGSEVSKIWAPQFAEKGCWVIDNSSYWRMDPDKRLIIPEINGISLKDQSLKRDRPQVIANPNCSTIQMLMALAPLHRAFGIKRIIVSTYQSVTGAGTKMINKLMQERADSTIHTYITPNDNSPVDPPIDLNVIPQIDTFLDNGYTKEEMKMVNETHKILGDNSISISATTVRVPVVGGHSESVNVEFHKSFTLPEVLNILFHTRGLVLYDDPISYPMPYECFGKDEVFVGRVRKDLSNPNTLNMWIVADNLRKGAATNAVQIAELL